jgi:hypothetical protein
MPSQALASTPRTGEIVSFEMKDIFQEFESEQQNMQVFKAVPHIRMSFPGDKTKVIFRPATDGDKAIYAQEWSAFIHQEEVEESGMKLEVLPGMSKGEANGYRSEGIISLKQLSTVSDANLGGLPLGARKRRDEAIDFLEKNWKEERDESFAALKKENKRLLADNKELAAENERLNGLLEQIQEQADEADDDAGPGNTIQP